MDASKQVLSDFTARIAKILVCIQPEIKAMRQEDFPFWGDEIVPPVHQPSVLRDRIRDVSNPSGFQSTYLLATELRDQYRFFSETNHVLIHRPKLLNALNHLSVLFALRVCTHEPQYRQADLGKELVEVFAGLFNMWTSGLPKESIIRHEDKFAIPRLRDLFVDINIVKDLRVTLSRLKTELMKLSAAVENKHGFTIKQLTDRVIELFKSQTRLYQAVMNELRAS